MTRFRLELRLPLVAVALTACFPMANASAACTPTGYVRAAMADFNRFASEEDWATLTSTLKTTDDPGTLCLLGMVHWRLTARGCAEHSSNPREPTPAEHRP